jgi:hypothetical protein
MCSRFYLYFLSPLSIAIAIVTPPKCDPLPFYYNSSGTNHKIRSSVSVQVSLRIFDAVCVRHKGLWPPNLMHCCSVSDGVQPLDERNADFQCSLGSKPPHSTNSMSSLSHQNIIKPCCESHRSELEQINTWERQNLYLY